MGDIRSEMIAELENLKKLREGLISTLAEIDRLIEETRCRIFLYEDR